MKSVPCVFCGRSLDPQGIGTHQLVHGWERVISYRASGNVRPRSDIALRERSDKWACDPCIGKLKRGIAPTQGSLIP
jgi:hypothetical protein